MFSIDVATSPQWRRGESATGGRRYVHKIVEPCSKQVGCHDNRQHCAVAFLLLLSNQLCNDDQSAKKLIEPTATLHCRLLSIIARQQFGIFGHSATWSVQSAEWRIAVKLATLLQLGPSVSIEIVCNFAEIDKLRRDAILFPIPLGKLKIGDLFLAFLGKKRKKCKRLCNKFDRIWRRQGEMQKCKVRRWQIAKLTSAKVLFALVFCFPTKLIERKNETIRNCFHYRHYRNI